jgi:replicative DNA helicase
VDDQVIGSKEAETAFLGSLMINPERMRDVIGILTPEMFTSTVKEKIFESMKEMSREGITFDTVCLADRLKQKGMLEHAGGFVGLSMMMDLSSSAGILDYAHIVRRDYFTRQLILKAKEIQDEAAKNGDGKMAGVIGETIKLIRELSTQANPVDTSLKGVVRVTTERITAKVDLLPIGHRRMDEWMGGLLRREPVIVAGRTSNLKTTFVADRIPFWIAQGLKVQVFSLEVPSDMYFRKIVCQMGRIDATALRRYALTKDQLEKFILKCNEIYSNFDGKLSILDFKDGMKSMNNIDRAVRSFKPDIFIVDYVTLIHTEHPQYRRLEIGENIEALKELGIDMDAVPIFVCQINRGAVTRKDGEEPFPKLEDLKETGEFEEKATEALLLYYKYSITKDKKDVHRVRVELAKSRYGPLGVLNLFHQPMYCELLDLGIEKFDEKGQAIG